ncbi:hypothetical protein PsorP6_001589 [Peronosclerospora sorghi]|uniref:Uncharacterized protein n=1 Tax=Peronosclerospora sorghi TaxID=230839 RepID=A0ACC0WRG0_9STRA|nr:hypothetical protein PsorP6_001589 [Peronosclerospora sorghi]
MDNRTQTRAPPWKNGSGAEPKISSLSPGHFETTITYSTSAASTKRAGTYSRSWPGTKRPLLFKKCLIKPQEHYFIALHRQPDGNPALHQQEIVDVIISSLLFDQDDDYGLPNIFRERSLKIFENIDPNTVEDPRLAETKYRVNISNPKQFNMVAGFLSTGVPFSQAEALIIMTKEVTGVAEIGTSKDERVAQYARFILALNLQHIYDILDNSWAFSIAMDMSTHM